MKNLQIAVCFKLLITTAIVVKGNNFINGFALKGSNFVKSILGFGNNSFYYNGALVRFEIIENNIFKNKLNIQGVHKIWHE